MAKITYYLYFFALSVRSTSMWRLLQKRPRDDTIDTPLASRPPRSSVGAAGSHAFSVAGSSASPLEFSALRRLSSSAGSTSSGGGRSDFDGFTASSPMIPSHSAEMAATAAMLCKESPALT